MTNYDHNSMRAPSADGVRYYGPEPIEEPMTIEQMIALEAEIATWDRDEWERFQDENLAADGPIK